MYNTYVFTKKVSKCLYLLSSTHSISSGTTWSCVSNVCNYSNFYLLLQNRNLRTVHDLGTSHQTAKKLGKRQLKKKKQRKGKQRQRNM